MGEIYFTGFKATNKKQYEDKATKVGFLVRKDVTGNLRYLVAGGNAGPKKLEKAFKVGAICLDDEEFLELATDGALPDHAVIGDD